MTFTQFPLNERLQRAIVEAGYLEPTPIQAEAIPIVLTGSDLLGTAQTGTGKTAAYVLPLLHLLMSNPREARKTRALVLTPTRELAEQVRATIKALGRHTTVRATTVYGGVGMAAQDRALRNGTEIIVACPGRLLDHATRGAVDFSGIECLVLDEADRMLDMGFLPDIKRIINLLPRERQTLLFGATFAPELDRFAAQIMTTPARIAVGESAPATTIAHAIYMVPAQLKTTLLIALLEGITSESVLIFTHTKDRADMVAKSLTRAGYHADVMHSNRTQQQRQHTLDAFRAGTIPYLVATDIAARGIDVSTVSHVINFDIPETADTYIHRIGRTGRATRSGEAFTLVTRDDYDIIRLIERSLGERLPSNVLEGFDYQQTVTGGSPTLVRGRAAANGGRAHAGQAYLSSPAYQAIIASVRQTGSV
ncbi:MAG TPA: DEAD/DEAH box helicase [Armatimonadota bacterium]|jgi:ATP-dependent RNA helicase RhlE